MHDNTEASISRLMMACTLADSGTFPVIQVYFPSSLTTQHFFQPNPRVLAKCPPRRRRRRRRKENAVVVRIARAAFAVVRGNSTPPKEGSCMRNPGFCDGGRNAKKRWWFCGRRPTGKNGAMFSAKSIRVMGGSWPGKS